MAKNIPEHLAIAPSRQVRLRYTGDGSTGAAGVPANPEAPEFWHRVTEAELLAIVGTGLYEHIGEYDAADDERDALARGAEEVS